MTNANGGRETRRHFLRLMGGVSAAAGGLILAGCKDDVAGAESVPATTPSTGGSTLPPAYTATDNDRLNFALQVHYLLAAYLQRSLDGSTLPASLTSGSGVAGQVSGGRQVVFSDAGLLASVREVSAATIARIGYLRRSLGGAVSAQPAIDIAGGQGSPFQAIAVVASTGSTTSTTPVSIFDPYASEKDFLLGAVALSTVVTSATTNLAWAMGTTQRASFGALSAGVAAGDAILRNALFVRADLEPLTPARGEQTLFDRAAAMSDGRDQYDGPSDLDQGIGGFSGSSGVNANIGVSDGNSIALRRTPEQALAVLYASAKSVSSGAFFPAGVNGTIHVSGANI